MKAMNEARRDLVEFASGLPLHNGEEVQMVQSEGFSFLPIYMAWRLLPVLPRSLCNACGLRFREVLRRERLLESGTSTPVTVDSLLCDHEEDDIGGAGGAGGKAEKEQAEKRKRSLASGKYDEDGQTTSIAERRKKKRKEEEDVGDCGSEDESVQL